jgi:hypothetical protein
LEDIWKPVLSGAQRTRALEAAEAIVRDLAAAPRVRRPPNLLQGHAGLALFFEAASRAVDPTLLDLVGHHLQLATVEYVRTERTALGLHGGLSGLGWVAAHLVSRYPDLDVEELCDATDEALEGELERSPWPHPCDIRDGLAGMGLYALERLPHPRARGLLERMVLKAEEASERSERGACWRIPRGYLHLYGDVSRYPNGVYTLGVAHGIPGALALLASAHSHGILRERAGQLLQEGFRWMADRAQPGAHPHFPHYFHGTEPMTDERFSWCVGNPAITSVLWWAARTWGHPEWEARTLEWAEAVAREALERRPNAPNANLCCGTAGTAQVYLRLFHATRRPLFAEAAVRWVEHTLALRQPGTGPGGYCFEQDPKRPDESLQFGAAGIALTLLAAATEQEPDWDRAFLFSLSQAPSRAED